MRSAVKCHNFSCHACNIATTFLVMHVIYIYIYMYIYIYICGHNIHVWNVWKTPLSKTTRHSLRGSFRPRSISRCPCSSTRTSRSKSSNGKRKQLRTRMSMNLYGLVPATATEIQRLLVCKSFTTAIKTSADSDVAASSFRKSSAASCSSHRLAIKHRSVSHTNQLLKKAVLQSYMDFPVQLH